MRTLTALALGAAALAACAPTSPPPTSPPPAAASAMLPPPAPSGARLAGAECFRTSDIRNHTIGDDRTLFLDVAGRDVYQVGMSGSCLAGSVSSDPIITRQPPGSSIVCRPLDLDIGIGRNGFERRCIVDSIVRLTPEQAAAMPPRLRP
jgi:hypothetical protein